MLKLTAVHFSRKVWVLKTSKTQAWHSQLFKLYIYIWNAIFENGISYKFSKYKTEKNKKITNSNIMIEYF